QNASQTCGILPPRKAHQRLHQCMVVWLASERSRTCIRVDVWRGMGGAILTTSANRPRPRRRGVLAVVEPELEKYAGDICVHMGTPFLDRHLLPSTSWSKRSRLSGTKRGRFSKPDDHRHLNREIL